MSALAKVLDPEFEHAFLERSESLGQLIVTLRRFSADASREDFSRLFQEATTLLELDDLELARMFKVSRPTIGRWARGESAPHPLGRMPVFRGLMQVAQAKLRHYPNAGRELRAALAA